MSEEELDKFYSTRRKDLDIVVAMIQDLLSAYSVRWQEYLGIFEDLKAIYGGASFTGDEDDESDEDFDDGVEV